MSSPRDIDVILQAVGFPADPLLEKTNILEFYQEWSSGDDLVEAAKRIGAVARRFSQGKAERHYEQLYRHFKADLFAQLLRQCGLKQRYLGIDAFVDMSQGCPRNLLTILKHVFDWAIFNGEKPFVMGKISVESQHAGVKEAAEWFFKDARMPGEDGVAIRNSIGRLATLFREIRFADKPSECSVIAFSVDSAKLTPEADRIVKLCAQWSLLLAIEPGQRDRNSERVDEKYELNRMLSPHWDLPISRRGTLALNRDLAIAIFDQGYAHRFEELARRAVDRMTAPWFGRKPKQQPSFFEQ
jgi:hypothetical protein